MRDSDIEDATRRAVLKTVAGAAGIGAAGTASAHEWGEEKGPAGENTWTSQREDTRGETNNAEIVGYHALGAEGTARRDPEREAQRPHYGGITEIRTNGDYAYVGFFSSGSETPGRGMAILDISDYTRIPADADTSKQQAKLENAELSVISFLRNNTASASVMDVKVSDDGDYAFLSTQPYQQLFGTIVGNSDDPTRLEGFDPTPNLGDEGATAQTSGIVAVDVSDKSNPETLANFSLEGSGSHNAYHHRIDGDDYIFGINDSGNLVSTGEGMFVLRFDRTTGTFELVNQWEYEGNLAQGDIDEKDIYPGDVFGVDPVGQEGGAYIHDMEIQDDPRTGTPVCYLAYWDRGMWALDASDPSDLKALGHFKMGASHFASPAPTLVDGKRVIITSQEISESSTHTGRVYLVDADGLFKGEDGYNPDGPTQLGELDMWEWQNEYKNPEKSNSGTTDDDSDVEFGSYDFSLSPHTSDFARHVDPATGEESFWVHQAHYGGGVQFLELQPGTDDGLVGDSRFMTDNGVAGPHETTDWRLTKRGYSRPQYDTPKDSRLEGLNYITPFVWGANQENGITFASDINQGIHAIKADGIPVGGADPVAGVTRTDDASVFTAGQTNQVDITLEFTDRDVLVRDNLPSGWEVEAGDPEADLGESESLTYFAEAPGETGSYTFGPVEVSADGGKTWHTLADTTDTAVVVGQSTNLAAGGLAVGTAGALSKKREALVDRVTELRSDGD